MAFIVTIDGINYLTKLPFASSLQWAPNKDHAHVFSSIDEIFEEISTHEIKKPVCIGER